MGSIFPYGLDSFPLPNSESKLNEVPHAELHQSESYSIVALQNRVGVTGSLVATTIDFELHSTSSGHDHDGINSRPVALGPDESGFLSGSGSYDLGYFSDLSASFRVGHVIDRFNRLINSIDTAVSSAISGNGIEIQKDSITLSPSASILNFSGSNISGSVAGPTVTISVFEDYRQLLYLADNGPYEHFGTGLYHEFIYDNRTFVSASTWYTDSLKTKKIVEKTYLRNSAKQATEINYYLYYEDGTSLKRVFKDTISYNGAVEQSRTRDLVF
jgi:hypothetical protein